MTDIINQSILNKARKDKFILVVTVPKALVDVNSSENRGRSDTSIISNSLQFSIQGFVVPAVRVDQAETVFAGQTVKFSAHHRPRYDNVSVKFNIDNEFNNYWVMYKWINIINDNKEAFFWKDNPDFTKIENGSIYDQYSSIFTVYGLDEYNNKKIQWDFHGVIPVGLGEIAYSYTDSGEAESSLEFAFSQLDAKLL